MFLCVLCRVLFQTVKTAFSMMFRPLLKQLAGLTLSSWSQSRANAVLEHNSEAIQHLTSPIHPVAIKLHHSQYQTSTVWYF